MKFKVGDTVEVVSTSYPIGCPVGSIGKVKVRYAVTGHVGIKVPHNTNIWSMQEMELMKAKGGKVVNKVAVGKKGVVKPRTSKIAYKVGDTVQLLETSGGSPEVGDIGVVMAVGSSTLTLTIDFPSQEGYLSDGSKVKLVKQPYEVGYKVGDKVRCIDSVVKTTEGNGGAGWKEGREFVVGRVGKSGILGGPLLWPEGGGHGVFATWVEPVNKLKVEEKPIKRVIAAPPTKKLGKHDILGQSKIHKQLELAVELNMPVLIVGDTGTGKTTIVKSVADKVGAEWIRFNLTGETTVDEFVGKYVLLNQETVWEDGVLLTAMKQGKWIIVDEVNVALPEILFVLHSLLDDDRSVMVSNHQGEVVKPHEDFRFFGTMNPVDEYAGTKDLNKAFKSRFGMILNMDYPNPKLESQIVHSKGEVDMPTAMQIVDVGQAIRKSKEAGEVFYTCSTRDLIQWGTLVGKLGIQDAFEVAILNKANGDREIVKKLYGKVLKGYEDAVKDGINLNLQELVDINKQIQADRADLDNTKSEIEKKVKEELLEQLMAKSKPNGSKEEAELKKLVDNA